VTFVVAVVTSAVTLKDVDFVVVTVIYVKHVAGVSVAGNVLVVDA